MIDNYQEFLNENLNNKIKGYFKKSMKEIKIDYDYNLDLVIIPFFKIFKKLIDNSIKQYHIKDRDIILLLIFSIYKINKENQSVLDKLENLLIVNNIIQYKNTFINNLNTLKKYLNIILWKNKIYVENKLLINSKALPILDHIYNNINDGMNIYNFDYSLNDKVGRNIINSYFFNLIKT